jgi:hypothetical protein
MRAEFKLDHEVRDDAMWTGSVPDSYYRHYSDRSARSLLSDADNRIPHPVRRGRAQGKYDDGDGLARELESLVESNVSLLIEHVGYHII